MRITFTLLFVAACTAGLLAQDDLIDTFYYRQNGVDINFHGVKVTSNARLRELELFDGMYPVTIVPRQVLFQSLKVSNTQSRLADSLSQLVNRLVRQNDLHTLELEKKDLLIQYQKNFIAFSDSTNLMLNKSITALNSQLDECRQVARDANKGLLGKKLWGILIGGGIGLGLGVLLGVAAN